MQTINFIMVAIYLVIHYYLTSLNRWTRLVWGWIYIWAYICVVCICLCDLSAYIHAYLILTYLNILRYMTSNIAFCRTEVLIMHIYIYVYECFIWFYIICAIHIVLMCFYRTYGIHIVLVWSLHYMLNMYCLHSYFCLVLPTCAWSEITW